MSKLAKLCKIFNEHLDSKSLVSYTEILTDLGITREEFNDFLRTKDKSLMLIRDRYNHLVLKSVYVKYLNSSRFNNYQAQAYLDYMGLIQMPIDISSDIPDSFRNIFNAVNNGYIQPGNTSNLISLLEKFILLRETESDIYDESSEAHMVFKREMSRGFESESNKKELKTKIGGLDDKNID